MKSLRALAALLCMSTHAASSSAQEAQPAPDDALAPAPSSATSPQPSALPPPAAPPPGVVWDFGSGSWSAPARDLPSAPSYAATTFPVRISTTEPGVRVSVERGSTPVASCQDDCVVQLSPGKYVFRVHAGSGTVGGTRTIDVGGPMHIRFDPDTSEHRWGGLALGIGGVVSLVVGAAAMIADSCIDCGDKEPRDEGTNIAGVMALIGLAATPTGWVMFGTSMKPEYEIESMNAQDARGRARRRHAEAPRSDVASRRRAAGPRVNVAVTPAQGGGMLGVGMSF